MPPIASKNLAVDRIDRLADTFAAIPFLVTVAQLDRFMRAGRRAGRNRGAAERAVFQDDIDFDGGIAAAVEDFAADNSMMAVIEAVHECSGSGFYRIEFEPKSWNGPPG